VKALLAGIQSFLLFFGTLVVAFAEEAAKEGEAAPGGYDSTAYVWIALIVIIVIYGIYDSFFKPVD
jgi:hypothetical protein